MEWPRVWLSPHCLLIYSGYYPKQKFPSSQFTTASLAHPHTHSFALKYFFPTIIASCPHILILIFPEQDVDNLDNEIPRSFMSFFHTLLASIQTLFMICYATPQFVAVIIPLAIFYGYVLVRFFPICLPSYQKYAFFKFFPLAFTP
jgi:hypothetical protein